MEDNMALERTSEELVKKLMCFDLGKNAFGFVYAQGEKTENSDINNALDECGGKPKECALDDYKTKGKKHGQPEFLITFKNHPDTIIVVECKKSVKAHFSDDYGQPSKYACDGVLYYSKYLKKYFNVFAIAQSGTKEENMRVTNFYWAKNAVEPQILKDIEDFLFEPENYIRHQEGEELKKTYSLEEIKSLAIQMNEKMRVVKMTQEVKPTFIAGVLLGLQDDIFSREYTKYENFISLSTGLEAAVKRVLTAGHIPEDRRDRIAGQLHSAVDTKRFKDTPLINDGSLLWYIKQLAFKIKPMMDHVNTSLDALSVFYHEFIQYSTGKDGKLLGQVLTPQHLTEFMASLAGVSKNDKVLDICCGSASFLVTAMHMMFKQCKTDAEFERVRKNGLFGVEIDENMYTLALTNMIIRQDGKSNMIYGDCFDKEVEKKLKNEHITIGLINPPYSIKKEPELLFVKQLLDILDVRGTGVVVVPVSCAIGRKFKEERKALMKEHTLKAVFSMPNDIFYPTGTNTCVMVWEAHVPHDKNKFTFFGYYKDDGFKKQKQLGRIDVDNKWAVILAEWLDLYERKALVVGKTSQAKVDVKDEWLCEAYMETDYSKLTQNVFQQTLNNYLAYMVKEGRVYEP